jgi:MFS family permease
VSDISENRGGWTTASLGVVILHALLIQAITFSLRPSLSYAALEAGMSVAWLGLLSACFALPGLALAIPAGQVTDRLGERATAVVGATLVVAATVTALLFSHSAVALVVATAVFGTGHLLSIISDQAILANRTSARRRDSVFGTYALMIALGQGVGGALLAVNAGTASTPDLALQFTLATVLAVVVLACAVLMRRSALTVAAPGDRQPATLRSLVRRPHVLRAVIASSLVVTAVEISLVYFPALGYERGFPAAVVSAMLVGRSTAAMASRVGLSLWIRLLGRRRLMVGSVAISAVLLAALAVPMGAVGTVIVCALFGFFNGVSQPLTLSWLTEIAPAGQRGTIMSVRVATVRISQTAIPAGVGLVSVALGAGGVFVIVGALVAVAAWMFMPIGSAPTAAGGPEPEPA